MVSDDAFNTLQKQQDELWQLQNRTRDERESYKVKLQDMTAERDRLAKENAELRESAAFYGDKFSHDIEQADRRSSQWERCFRLAFGLKDKYYSQLTAANAAHAKLVLDYEQVLADLEASNATLDALREKFGHHKPLPFCHNCDSYKTEWQDNECLNCGVNLDTSSLMLCDIYAILYPQQKETTDDER